MDYYRGKGESRGHLLLKIEICTYQIEFQGKKKSYIEINNESDILNMKRDKKHQLKKNQLQIKKESKAHQRQYGYQYRLFFKNEDTNNLYEVNFN